MIMCKTWSSVPGGLSSVCQAVPPLCTPHVELQPEASAGSSCASVVGHTLGTSKDRRALLLFPSRLHSTSVLGLPLIRGSGPRGFQYPGFSGRLPCHAWFADARTKVPPTNLWPLEMASIAPYLDTSKLGEDHEHPTD